MTTPPLPEQIEAHRDRMWRRDEDLRIESAVDAERFIGDVGFANTLMLVAPVRRCSSRSAVEGMLVCPVTYRRTKRRA